MLPILLLLIALACLAVGLALASAGWLIGSLVASAVAAIVVVRQRHAISARRPAAAGSKSGAGAPDGRGNAGTAPGSAAASVATVAVTVPAAATGGGADGAREVWVVDGEPLYHARGCPALSGKDGEPVPLQQALEDGFTDCPDCDPRDAATVRSVLVVDGRPDYHLPGCTELDSADAEPVPLSQAVADGFAPCPTCRPEQRLAVSGGTPAVPVAGASAVAAPGPASVPAPGAADAPHEPLAEVWVVDGRPRYHRSGCAIIEDEPAEAVPRAQAGEDGFVPCSLCQPDGTPGT